jgi:hypothetical protein
MAIIGVGQYALRSQPLAAVTVTVWPNSNRNTYPWEHSATIRGRQPCLRLTTTKKLEESWRRGEVRAIVLKRKRDCRTLRQKLESRASMRQRSSLGVPAEVRL